MLSRRALGSVAAAALLGGCAVQRPATPGATAGSPSPTPTGTPSPAAATPSEATPSPTATSASASATASKAPSAAPAAEPFTVNGIVLVNRDHPLLRSYVPELVGSEPQRLTRDAKAAMTKLIAGADADGLYLTIRSGYRSWDTQKEIFDKALVDNDEVTARRYFAEPGKSEHQTGLAADLWDGVNRGTAFTALPQAAWLAKHCTEFGFILRYPNGKESITQVAYESWHMRYVGLTVAKDFAASPGLTLEEYLGQA